MSILEWARHELRIAHGLTLMTPSLHGWEAFPTPRALTHTRITWALSPSAPQVPGVTPRSPLCLWCFGHPFREVRDTVCHSRVPLVPRVFRASLWRGVQHRMRPCAMHRSWREDSIILKNIFAHLFKRMPKTPWAQRGPWSVTQGLVALMVRRPKCSQCG